MTERQSPYVTRPGETEADFQTWVLDLAKVTGWLCHHTRPAWSLKGYRTPIQGHPGFPDWVFVRELLLIVELKRENGKLGIEQKVWAFAFRKLERLCPIIQYRVWRPSDRPEIERTLKGEV